ncbi:hypothetical protein [Cohnella sp. 56]|uniref:hypothetical protein n=1 Tax=Cohnella sp. 56 TaxID=3113722 RepID=UPI0030EB039F
MLLTLLILAFLALSVIAAFSDKDGQVVSSLAQTAAVHCLIFAVDWYVASAIWLCALASFAWLIHQLARSNTRWR